MSAFPTWTSLPPLPLIDAGTENTESIGSYAVRLARLCGVPWARFLHFVDTESESVPRMYHDPVRLIGPGPVAIRRARTLERLTGQTLLGGTFYGLTEILSGRDGTLNKHASWCPKCLEQGIDDIGTHFSRLIWEFSAYSHCAIHGARIQSACQHCGFQKIGRSSLSVCPKCQGALSKGAEYAQPGRSESWKNHCIEELLQWTSGNPQSLLSLDGLTSFIEAEREQRRRREPRYRGRIFDSESRAKWILWQDTKIPTSYAPYIGGRVDVGDLLNAAGKSSLSVLDMLLRPVASASKVLPGIGFKCFQPFDLSKIHRSWVRFSELVDALVADQKALLPAMREITLASDVVGRCKVRVPSSYAIYAVHLRIQRFHARNVSPSRVNTAFRLALRLCRQGIEQGELVRRVVLQRLVPDRFVDGVIRSAAIVCEFYPGTACTGD
ncbi:MAG: TniQ family protein [Stenotrophomonas lactitubi]|uniref:TniQ family protein n=1 Tax=Stenotrophomonas lactitubi TaxID=2045214 RepID=UPI003D13F9FF